MSTTRDKARTILESALPVGREFRSNGADGQYKAMTGIDHSTLTTNWTTKTAKQPNGGIMTGCNGFTGWYGGKMGSSVYLGGFDLKGIVAGAGKPDAWTESTRDNKPAYGDILRHASFHVDVCMGYDGGRLVRGAAGQAGKSAGYDSLKRVVGQSVYDHTKLVGWIDIDIYFGDPDSKGHVSLRDPARSWLYGWWTVWDGQYYYYYFDPNGTVHYVKKQPKAGSPPPNDPASHGAWTLDGGALVINWNKLAGVAGDATQETFADASDDTRTMHGTSNRYSPLIAIKIS